MADNTSRLSRVEIANYARAAGFPDTEIPMAVAVALAESGGRPTAVGGPNSNGSKDYGLYQINSVHKELLAAGDWKDPAYNAKMAYRIWKDAGGKWTPWSVFNHGSYKRYYSANDSATDSGATDNISVDVAAGAVTGIGSILNSPFGIIGQRSFWIRVGISVLGVALIIAGVVIIFRKPIAQGTKTIVNLVGPGGKVGAVTKLAGAASAAGKGNNGNA